MPGAPEMTRTKDEALKLALEALEYWAVHGKLHQPTEEAITAIKQALAAPVQEPVRSMSDEQDAFEKVFKLPDGITRFDGGYAPTSYSAWSAQQQCYRWEGWKARMGLATPPAAQKAIEFGMHGKKMMFKVGVQQFTLDYEPDTQDEFNFMRDMLVHAFSIFTPDVKTTPPAQPAVPDAIIEAGESPDYRDGWNDCRQTMLQILKARTL
jgi:hypothetical protein